MLVGTKFCIFWANPLNINITAHKNCHLKVVELKLNAIHSKRQQCCIERRMREHPYHNLVGRLLKDLAQL